MHFSTSNRARLKEENPGASFADLAKLVSAAWKEVGSEEKQKYEAMAAEDKQRYAKEMKNYTPPADSKGQTKKKDPNAPKKPMTSFMLFSNANRAKVKEQNPGISFGELVSATVYPKVTS